MIEQDTIRLLRECDAGVKMGISSIDDVLDDVKSVKLKEYLVKCKNEKVFALFCVNNYSFIYDSTFCCNVFNFSKWK